MLHLSLVQNLLRGRWRRAHILRRRTSRAAARVPGTDQIALLPFGEEALRHFAFLERPEGPAVDNRGRRDVRRGRAATAPPDIEDDMIGPIAADFATSATSTARIQDGLELSPRVWRGAAVHRAESARRRPASTSGSQSSWQ